MRTIIIAIAISLLSCAASAQTATNSLGDDPSKFDAQMESAMLKKDTAFLSAVLADDVRFTHGTGLVQDKAKWLESAPKSKATVRDLDSVEVEPHGDVVETTGHIHVLAPSGNNPDYQLWYVRVYAKRDGRWQLLSNRTVKQVNGAVDKKQE